MQTVKNLFLFENPDYQPTEIEHCTLAKDRAISGLEHLDDRILRKAWPVQRNQVITRIAESGLPTPGEHLSLVTMRNFSAIELLDYILDTETILEASIVLYSISRASCVQLLKHHANRKIRNLQLLVSNLRNTAVKSKEEASITILKTAPQIDLFFANSHAKIMVCRTDKNNHYIMTGSGNLANNSRIEQYCIDNDPTLYQFHRDWIQTVKNNSEKI
jgi:hypothetical protein